MTEKGEKKSEKWSKKAKLDVLKVLIRHIKIKVLLTSMQKSYQTACKVETELFKWENIENFVHYFNKLLHAPLHEHGYHNKDAKRKLDNDARNESSFAKSQIKRFDNVFGKNLIWKVLFGQTTVFRPFFVIFLQMRANELEEGFIFHIFC